MNAQQLSFFAAPEVPPGPTALCFTCRQWLPRAIVRVCDCCGEQVCDCCRDGGAHGRHFAAYAERLWRQVSIETEVSDGDHQVQ